MTFSHYESDERGCAYPVFTLGRIRPALRVTVAGWHARLSVWRVWWMIGRTSRVVGGGGSWCVGPLRLTIHRAIPW